MQKIMYKGLAKDESTLKSLNIKNGEKLMLIGSTLQDVAQIISKPTTSTSQSKSAAEITSGKKKLCEETAHKKIIDKFGKPDDVLPGILNTRVNIKSFKVVTFIFKKLNETNYSKGKTSR